MRRNIAAWRGFTMVEVILALILLMLVIFIGAPKMREAKESAESKAVAKITKVVNFGKDYPSWSR